jgi:hypothetical protein
MKRIVCLLPEYCFGSERKIYIDAGPFFLILTNSGINGTVEAGSTKINDNIISTIRTLRISKTTSKP